MGHFGAGLAAIAGYLLGNLLIESLKQIDTERGFIPRHARNQSEQYFLKFYILAHKTGTQYCELKKSSCWIYSYAIRQSGITNWCVNTKRLVSLFIFIILNFHSLYWIFFFFFNHLQAIYSLWIWKRFRNVMIYRYCDNPNIICVYL